MKKWKCTVCNYIHTGDEPPEKCPVCGADKSVFIEVVEETNDQTSEKKKWKCTACSYIYEGDEPPEKCPACGADKSMFIEVVDEKINKESEVEEISETATESESKKSSGRSGIIGNLVMRHHLHPITVHTPNGVIPVAVIFLVLAIVFKAKAFEIAAFFNMIFVLLTMPVVIGTGYHAWQKKYNGAKTFVFVTKIICSAIVAVLLGLLVCWRFIDAEVVLSGTTASWVYLALCGVILAAVGIAGHLGGKLVFGGSK